MGGKEQKGRRGHEGKRRDDIGGRPEEVVGRTTWEEKDTKDEAGEDTDGRRV